MAKRLQSQELFLGRFRRFAGLFVVLCKIRVLKIPQVVRVGVARGAAIDKVY